MLKNLTVHNLAIVEEASVDFAPGLNVITGETGAGKSVLMGALRLVLGGKGEADEVRDGAKEAEVEAEFEGAGGEGARSKEQGASEEVVLRRTVGANGKSRAWIDEEAVSLAELKEKLAGHVDIHGAQSNQRILEERYQREALDSYGGIPRLAAWKTYAAAWSDYQMTLAALKDVNGEGDVAEELDMLIYQVNELKEAALTEGDEELAARMRAVEEKASALEDARQVSAALDGEHGIGEMLRELVRPVGRIEGARSKGQGASEEEQGASEEDLSLEERLEEIIRGVDDLSREIGRRLLRGEDDREEMMSLEELDQRLTLVNRLKRKYRAADVKALLDLYEKKSVRLAKLEGLGAERERLAQEQTRLEKILGDAGAAVSAARRETATKLAKAVTKELHDLGFLQAKFGVEVGGEGARSKEQGASGEFRAWGVDTVEFMFEPNPGEAARPLAAIASSGETARVMLALKSVLSEHDRTEVLVFDEIDANIGGEVGRVVGEKLRKVARHHQVIAITHLPQSAVYGARHFKVEKRVSGGRTRTTVAVLEGDARVKEIARMLGGEKLTSVVKQHAEELLRYGKDQG